ncbi:MAG TPA: hypothetical protein VJQ50_19725 [Terriglobales bacterium]|nr:hypothetical protein [Terriglobales bacterium]
MGKICADYSLPRCLKTGATYLGAAPKSVEKPALTKTHTITAEVAEESGSFFYAGEASPPLVLLSVLRALGGEIWFSILSIGALPLTLDRRKVFS